MNNIVAMGWVSDDGNVYKGTPGITITDGEPDGLYRVNFPENLVNDGNYIIQLTSESRGQLFNDIFPTTISYQGKTKNGFLVNTYSRSDDNPQSVALLTETRTNWNFVIYEIEKTRKIFPGKPLT